jgi:hypothetical protein
MPDAATKPDRPIARISCRRIEGIHLLDSRASEGQFIHQPNPLPPDTRAQATGIARPQRLPPATIARWKRNAGA